MTSYHNHNLSQEYHFTEQSNSFYPDLTPKPNNSNPHSLQTTPNWLNNALLRTHYNNGHDDDNNNENNDEGVVSNNVDNVSRRFLNLSITNDSATIIPASQWRIPEDEDSLVEKSEAEIVGNGGGGGEMVNWEIEKYKAEILGHPLYEQLLSAHVACLRIATPVDQLPRIDAQLAQSQNVVAKYSAFGHAAHNMVVDDKELDHFMPHYVLLLCSFKEKLQQHVRVHALEAVMACWEIERSLQSLTGVSPGEGTSDDEDDKVDSDANLFDGSLDGTDSMEFGPLIPTEKERSLMERGYKEIIVDIREEILRKRRAGKLPGDTTSVLKAWWQSHSKWPYPTEKEKARLVQETGLQLKQINNWFINQRKRNWHSNPSTSNVSKSKRKR
ncbi:hypothetical protein RIF29_27218 [Crotalaria pallida]|uniref:Homeobox domain-containing protein n=1 Tax=Crotalaria pallida TaxID=3830 RepID=A0AAN9HYJ6_CROPI